MRNLNQNRPLSVVISGPQNGKEVPNDVQPLVQSVAHSLALDPRGPILSLSVGDHWPEKFEGYSRVLVFDGTEPTPESFSHIHIRSKDGQEIVASFVGGNTDFTNLNENTKQQSLSYRQRAASVRILGLDNSSLEAIDSLNTAGDSLTGSSTYYGIPNSPWKVSKSN